MTQGEMRVGRFLTTLLLSATLATGVAAAPLTRDIEGVSGSGQVSETFGGSQKATGPGLIGNFDAIFESTTFASQFHNLGECLANRDNVVLNFAVVSGSAEASVDSGMSSTSSAITGLGLDADDVTSTQSHDIGPVLAAALPFEDGDTIALSGTLTIFGIDIDTFLQGIFNSGPSGAAETLSDGMDLRLTITELTPSAAIPVPASLPRLIGAMGGLALVGRRKVRR